MAVGSSLGREKRQIEILSFFLENLGLSAPITINDGKTMNFITLPPNDGLGVKELCVKITKPNLLISRFLEPKHLLLF